MINYRRSFITLGPGGNLSPEELLSCSSHGERLSLTMINTLAYYPMVVVKVKKFIRAIAIKLYSMYFLQIVNNIFFNFLSKIPSQYIPQNVGTLCCYICNLQA
jgi:hypothetical protein